MAVTAGLLILVAIALVGALYLFGQRFVEGSDVVQAQANLISNRYVSGKPTHVIAINLQSVSESRLTVTEITVIGVDNNGAPVTGILTGGTGSIPGYSVTISPPLGGPDASVDPNSNKQITLTFTGGAGGSAGTLVEVSFQVKLTDDAGNSYTVQTNSVTLS